MQIEIYDTTLRDGAQGEGVNFSLDDKVLIARRLDEVGVDFVEGGYPLSNPKDAEFFQRIAADPLKHSKLCAFGMTRRRGMKPADDPGMKSLMDSQAPVVTIVGKTSDFHVAEVLRVSEQENIDMIAETIAYFVGEGREVIYDAEHCFDGLKINEAYALQTLTAAADAGAMRIVMCDTNGGTMPEEVAHYVKLVQEAVDKPVGIHTHNDCELAIANSLAAVDAGATHVQGTINGFGERCGNADLISVMANLGLKKKGYQVLGGKQTEHLTELSRYVYEIANMGYRINQPFVGASAFAHKGGMHVHAVNRVAHSYEHIPPESVGNERRVLVSELSGRSNILAMATKLNLQEDKELMDRILHEVVELENQGYQFEAAEASFALLVQRIAGTFAPHFELVKYHVSTESRGGVSLNEGPVTEATVKLSIDDEIEHRVAEGDGPINALDGALRKALKGRFPALAQMQLVDYKVRVINSEAATAASVRVIIETRDSDGETWGTVGVNENVIQASWDALVDSFEYKLAKEGRA
ncbi:2-isopropylmalate synthase [Posidoniimonas polymericola]|uniref:Citramalate synthase n=1 Tax=Posidoniimonas polymericola TaxID=2528002 RepID=A0A5C5YID8_9BACT|nr:citramalate synthase [Posidoniimonas polymericola]TWT74631.1 2-isopropylmalate synthase [Posidoniimonas polymericola]